VADRYPGVKMEFLLLLLQSAPLLVLERDDTVVRASCTLRVPPGLVIADANGDGVLHVLGDGIEIAFEEGSVLRGAPPEASRDGLEGIGIRVAGARGVKLSAPRVEGFRCAVLAREADGLQILDGEFARNFAQRLHSTPEAEDGADWLWPHSNDAEEWRLQYGAAISVHRSREVELARNRVREQQNGILLDRVQDARIYDNDASFLSGWGLAMWRSSGNLVSRNAFDFCIRGYSHGVYNRGQDSAGILLFEQCSRNHFLENSATHGGDGVFGFAGKEALGEEPAPTADFDYLERGCNANWFVGNDFSYAAAHGLELTFSFRNRILDNRLVGNAICGLWLGYCQQTLIAQNVIERNGDAGYGLERGGINIDHSRDNQIVRNEFARNVCGVHLWRFASGIIERPWGRANRLDGAGNLLAGNRFVADRVGFHLRGGVEVAAFLNEFGSVPQERLLEDDPQVSEGVAPLPLIPQSRREAIGSTRPVGARAHLAGREQILMTEWGPWDHEGVLLHRLPGETGSARYALLPPGLDCTAEVRAGAVVARVEPDAAGTRVVIEPNAPGWTPYKVVVRGDGFEQVVTGNLLAAEWEAAFFATDFNPREEEAEWSRVMSAALAEHPLRLRSLQLPFGGGGPRDLAAVRAAAGATGAAALPGAEHFGTVARTRLRLPAGLWNVATLSDDGVRVRVSAQSGLLIDNWTWHGPTRNEAQFRVDAAAAADPSGVEFFVEHFELDGHAVLEFSLERVGD
jgi:parallel beta-helix repeat protein